MRRQPVRSSSTSLTLPIAESIHHNVAPSENRYAQRHALAAMIVQCTVAGAHPSRRAAQQETAMTPSPLDQLFHDYVGAVPGASAILSRDGAVLAAAAF